MAAAGLAAAAGCRQETCPPIGFYSSGDLSRIYRVVLVEPECELQQEGIAQEVTDALAQAIQNKRLFHVEVLRRTDEAYGRMPSVRRPETLRKASPLRQALKCDAILIGSITAYRPYPRMGLGLYLQLLDLKNGLPAWVVDHVWDTTDRSTEQRIARYFRENVREGYDPIDWRLATTSPKAFVKFVAHEAICTMPERNGVRPAAGSPSPAGASGAIPRQR